MDLPKDLLFTKEHEWIRVNGQKGIVGITGFAQQQLGDVVFVEMPTVGTTVTRSNTFGVVESVKTVSDLYAPGSGKILKINTDLEANPEKVNHDPYGEGWMVEIELSSPDELSGLLTPEQYSALIEEEH